MSTTFRAWKIDETLLLPATVGDFVSKDHLSRFVLSLVVEALDLTAITGTYGSAKGQPPFHPAMMTALLLYAYCRGIYSSRRIAKACRERTDFMVIVGFDPPDFRTISDFRKRHLKALEGLFVQVLLLCERAGLVKLGHVAFDGSKIKANASKHKAMSYERMKQREAELKTEVDSWLKAAERTDAEEDKALGKSKDGGELPKWVADKKKRLAKIGAAKAAVEAAAMAAAAAEAKARAEDEERRKAAGRKKPGRPAAPPKSEPEAKAQRNFTDPESRIMKSKDGFVQAYNAQIAVDNPHQIIVAQSVTQDASDQHQLVPMTDAVEANLGRKPQQLSADSGYCSEANLEALEKRGIEAYVATGRAKHAVSGTAAADADPTHALAATIDTIAANIGAITDKTGAVTDKTDAAAKTADAAAKEATPEKATRVAAMRERLKAGGYEGPYRLRKQLPEPVFGQIKQARGFRQFLMRGVEKVRAEWALVCTAHNILKLAAGRRLQAA